MPDVLVAYASIEGHTARRLFAAVGGHDTDTSRDYDYTNWEAVDSFATAFSRNLT